MAIVQVMRTFPKPTHTARVRRGLQVGFDPKTGEYILTPDMVQMGGKKIDISQCGTVDDPYQWLEIRDEDDDLIAYF